MSVARVAWIDLPRCVGCTLCVEACPFDAIAGVAERAHRVIPELCTECALCLPACPVDCVSLRPDPAHPTRDRDYRRQARDRARRRLRRRAALRETRESQLREAHAGFRDGDAAARRAAIHEAVARARGSAASPS